MSLDPIIRSAIEIAVREEGQPAALTSRLTAWYEGLVKGKERLDDRDSVARHLELLYDAVTTKAALIDSSGEES